MRVDILELLGIHFNPEVVALVSRHRKAELPELYVPGLTTYPKQIVWERIKLIVGIMGTRHLEVTLRERAIFPLIEVIYELPQRKSE